VAVPRRGKAAFAGGVGSMGGSSKGGKDAAGAAGSAGAEPEAEVEGIKAHRQAGTEQWQLPPLLSFPSHQQQQQDRPAAVPGELGMGARRSSGPLQLRRQYTDNSDAVSLSVAPLLPPATTAGSSGGVGDHTCQCTASFCPRPACRLPISFLPPITAHLHLSPASGPLSSSLLPPALPLPSLLSTHACIYPCPCPAAFPKRILVMSPHPDDDCISMGGTLIRLIDQGHEVRCACCVCWACWLGSGTKLLLHQHGGHPHPSDRPGP